AGARGVRGGGGGGERGGAPAAGRGGQESCREVGGGAVRVRRRAWCGAGGRRGLRGDLRERGVRAGKRARALGGRPRERRGVAAGRVGAERAGGGDGVRAAATGAPAGWTPWLAHGAAGTERRGAGGRLGTRGGERVGEQRSRDRRRGVRRHDGLRGGRRCVDPRSSRSRQPPDADVYPVDVAA